MDYAKQYHRQGELSVLKGGIIVAPILSVAAIIITIATTL